MSAEARQGTEAGDTRRRVESLIDGLPGGGGQASFSHLWKLGAFALAVAAYHAGQYEWSEFCLSLIESIRQWEQNGAVAEGAPWSYYEHWLAGLETVFAGDGLLSEADLDERTKSVQATPRNANHHEAHREPVAIFPAMR